MLATGEVGDVLPLCGARGTTAWVDTSNCYHFGSRPAPRPRWLLYLQYATAFSIEMPVWSRRPDPIPGPEALDPVSRRIRELVLGPYTMHRARTGRPH